MQFKRFFLILLSLCVFNFSPYAENLQIVMPKIIYTGDTVEIRYIFHSEAKIFGKEFENQSAKQVLRNDYPFFLSQKNDFYLKSAVLEKLNSEYTLTIEVIPWKTGFLQIPPFNLADYAAFSQSKNSNVSVPVMVSLSAIEIKSLIQKTGKKSFLPQLPPVSLPGTTALLVTFFIVLFVLFSLFIFTIIRLPKIIRLIENLSHLYFLRKNSRKAIKKIKELKKNSSSIPEDKDFATNLQHILRDFLSGRFAWDFSSVTTDSLYPILSDICGGDLNSNQETVMENLTGIFSRLDYIRFSQNARFLTSCENDNLEERIFICKTSIKLIKDFDSDDQEEDLK